MAKNKKTKKASTLEMDSVFILKLVLFLVLGSQWLHVVSPSGELPIPVGAIIGIFFAMHEHFKIDRKSEYAILLLAMFVGFWLPMGITLVR